MQYSSYSHINGVDSTTFHKAFNVKGFRNNYLNAAGDGSGGSAGTMGTSGTITTPPKPKFDPRSLPAGTAQPTTNANAGIYDPTKPMVTPALPKFDPRSLPGKIQPTTTNVKTAPAGSLPPSYPGAGTVIGATCEGYNRVAKIADGRGGYTTRITKANSTECGYTTGTTLPGGKADAPPVNPTPTQPNPLPVVIQPIPTGIPPINDVLGGGGFNPGGGGNGGGVAPSGFGSGGGGTSSDGGLTDDKTSTDGLAQEINWPLVIGAVASVGVTYWFLRDKKAAA